MRRPSPLPQPPASARREPPAPSRDVARDLASERARFGAGVTVDYGAPGDGEVTAPRADVDPHASVSHAAATGSDAAASQALPHGDAMAGDEPVRMRDIWRAARARRRALRSEVRRFTVRSRRRRTIWLIAALSSLLVVAATVGAAYSPLFAVEKIEVIGTTTLSPSQVEQALAGQLGTPLALVDDSAVKRALVAFPLVESYTLEARPPHDLAVRIVERTPIGAVQSDAGWSLVDAAGVVLSTTPTPPSGVARIEADGGVGGAAFTAIARVLRALPAGIRATVTDATASSRDDVTLRMGDSGAKVVWGSVDDTPLKAALLQSALAARPAGSVSCYDVSSPTVLVVCGG